MGACRWPKKQLRAGWPIAFSKGGIWRHCCCRQPCLPHVVRHYPAGAFSQMVPLSEAYNRATALGGSTKGSGTQLQSEAKVPWFCLSLSGNRHAYTLRALFTECLYRVHLLKRSSLVILHPHLVHAILIPSRDMVHPNKISQLKHRNSQVMMHHTKQSNNPLRA